MQFVEVSYWSRDDEPVFLYFDERWGTSVFIFSLCLVTCCLVCRLVFKIPCACLRCKITQPSTTQCPYIPRVVKYRMTLQHQCGILLPSFSLSNILKQFARKIESPAYDLWSFTTDHCTMSLFSCQKQCYYEALLSLCQIKEKKTLKKRLVFICCSCFYIHDPSFYFATESCDVPPSFPVAFWPEGCCCRRSTPAASRPGADSLCWYC